MSATQLALGIIITVAVMIVALVAIDAGVRILSPRTREHTRIDAGKKINGVRTDKEDVDS